MADRPFGRGNRAKQRKHPALKRLFVAVDLPEPVANSLIALKRDLPGVRWLAPEQIHLTLSFLGNVNAVTEAALREKLTAIRFAAFFLPVSGM